MADKRVKKIVKKDSKKGKSADKKPNTQTIRRKKYSTVLASMQVGSQNYKILSLLIQKGSTTSMDIITSCNVVSPTGRMSELRNHYGLPISKTMIRKKDKDGKVITYGKYTLEV